MFCVPTDNVLVGAKITCINEWRVGNSHRSLNAKAPLMGLL